MFFLGYVMERVFSSYIEVFFASCLLILPLLYKFNNVFRYYAKFTLFVGPTMLKAAFSIPIYCLRPFNPLNFLFSAFVLNRVRHIVGIKYIVRNPEYLAEDKAFIITCNHQSLYDILGMFVIWPIMRKCTVISRNEFFYVWPAGLIAWLGGVIFIPRTNPTESKAIMTAAGEKIKKEKVKMWIFPEGKRFTDGILHPFKKGAFHLAITAQLPILPIVFSHYYFIDHKDKRFDSGNVIITILPPISTEGKTLDDLDELLDETYKKMDVVLRETTEESKSMEKL